MLSKLCFSEATRYMEKEVGGTFSIQVFYIQHCQPSLACLPSGDGGGGLADGAGGAGLADGGGLDSGGLAEEGGGLDSGGLAEGGGLDSGGLAEGGGLDSGGPVPRCTNGLTVVARNGDCTLGAGNGDSAGAGDTCTGASP